MRDLRSVVQNPVSAEQADTDTWSDRDVERVKASIDRHAARIRTFYDTLDDDDAEAMRRDVRSASGRLSV